MTDLMAQLKGYDLKKQTQFVKGQNDAKPVQAKVYGNLDGWMRRENKANLPAFGRKY
jgi:hypothetical protein